eukprot:COSAG05_NODE_792_length_7316_cov_31.215325_7_plen_65_part_00
MADIYLHFDALITGYKETHPYCTARCCHRYAFSQSIHMWLALRWLLVSLVLPVCMRWPCVTDAR